MFKDKAFINLLSFIISLLFISYFFIQIDYKTFGSLLNYLSINFFVVGTILFLIWCLLSAFRFLLFFNSSQINNGKFYTFIFFVKYYWSTVFLPGHIGIDFFKLINFKFSDFGLSKVFNIILFEKICGLILIILSIIYYYLLKDTFIFESNFYSILFFLIFSYISLLAILFVFKFYLKSKFIFKRLKFISLDYTNIYKLSFYSLLIHICGFLFYVLVFFSLGLEVNLIFILFISPILFLVSAIPLSIGGWGIREFFTIFLINNLNQTNSSELVASLFGILILYFGLLSLLSLLFGKLNK